MTTENNAVVAAALDTLQLFNLLASDFQPRTHKQICELAALHGHTWSSGKVFGMLATLQAGHFLRQSATNKEWSLAPQITAIAVNYHESIIRRSQAILDEVAEIKAISERMQ